MMDVDFSRKTHETQITGTIRLYGTGIARIDTECGFFNHMLEQLVFYSGMDLTMEASADTHVDYHHLVEDVGLALGKAVLDAVGEKVSLQRYGHILLPMDDALVLVALDFGGRPFLRYDLALKSSIVGDFDTELVPEFLRAWTNSAGITLHVQCLAGCNTHHIIEALFKGVGMSLKQALTPGCGLDIRSTKGIVRQGSQQ